MGKIMHILIRVLVGGDAKTLSNKNELISSECFALHVQNVNPLSGRRYDLIFVTIDLLFTQYTP